MNSGILLALAAYAVYAWGDGIVKALGGQLSVFEIGFCNTLVAGIFLFFLKPEGERWRGFWRMKRPWAVHARAASGLVAGVLSVYAFTTIPLAEVYALIFLAPMLVTLLSIVILKEHVGPWRWAAVFAGFVGVLLIVRPGFRTLELGHLAAFFLAFLGAATIILMRSLAAGKQTTMLATLVGYSLVFNGIAAAATSSFELPGWKVLALVGLAGACTAGGHRLQLLATRRSPGEPDRADALFPDDLGSGHRHGVLPGISGLDHLRRPIRHRRFRPADAGARDRSGSAPSAGTRSRATGCEAGQDRSHTFCFSRCCGGRPLDSANATDILPIVTLNFARGLHRSATPCRTPCSCGEVAASPCSSKFFENFSAWTQRGYDEHAP